MEEEKHDKLCGRKFKLRRACGAAQWHRESPVGLLSNIWDLSELTFVRAGLLLTEDWYEYQSRLQVLAFFLAGPGPGNIWAIDSDGMLGL